MAKRAKAKKRVSKRTRKPPAKKRATMAAAPAMKAAAKKPSAGALGCCTIVGLPGPNKVYPHITQQRCIELADELDGNPRWYAGECA
jgi:hypothetical protein